MSVAPDFTIHDLPAGGGTLALSPLPGRSRHYYTDWLRLLDWQPDLVVTVCTQAELDRKGAGTLGRDLAAAGIAWRYWPVPDYGTPLPAQEESWPDLARDIRAVLASRGRVLVHCFGGCGRSGMVVARVLASLGEPPAAALARLRAVRPCALETAAQEAWAARG